MPCPTGGNQKRGVGRTATGPDKGGKGPLGDVKGVNRWGRTVGWTKKKEMCNRRS